MQNANVIELIGYLASILVMFSLMMSSIIKLRIINFSGSVLFAIYGLLIKAYPVFLVNATIALINIYYLFKLFKKDQFSKIEISNPAGDVYLKKFIDFYDTDIKKFFPNYNLATLENAILIFRNASPVGFFAYKKNNDSIDIIIDYAAPNYRDFKNARFIFSELEKTWKSDNIKIICARSFNSRHSKYLEKIGFAKKSDNLYVKEI